MELRDFKYFTLVNDVEGLFIGSFEDKETGTKA